MNKLFAALIASFFAVSTAFAASHMGAPTGGASAPKMEKKEDKAKDGMAKDSMAKDGMADKKAMKKTKKAKKAKDSSMKEEKKS